MSYIPYGRQNISQLDIDAVIDVLRSDWITQGPFVDYFEQALSSYCQAEYGIAISNATSALHLACIALGVTDNDWVWTSPNSFIASANCARYCGAKVDFVDIDSDTYNLCPLALEEKLKKAALAGCLPKVVIPVHFAGQSCNMREIKKLAERYEFKIIEDASHALGGRYCEYPIGSCQYSDLSVFSFHPVKMITTGEGGVVTTNDMNIANKIRLLRSHGMVRQKEELNDKTQGEWYYEQVALGYNYRLTDIQCALGLSQLKSLDDRVQKRNERAMYYDQQLQSLPLILPCVTQENQSSFHLYVAQVDEKKTKINRDQLFNALRSDQIGVNVHYIPIHLQPYYKQFGFKMGDFPIAEKYARNAITLPLYPTLTPEEQVFVINKLHQYFI